MDVPGVEIIDLTGSAPQSPVPVLAGPMPKSVRETNRKRRRAQAQAQAQELLNSADTRSHIVISDSEEASITASQKEAPAKITTPQGGTSNEGTATREDVLEEGEVTENSLTSKYLEKDRLDDLTVIENTSLRGSGTETSNNGGKSPSSALFFFDTNAASSLSFAPEEVEVSKTDNSLLLPSHVLLDPYSTGGTNIVTEASTLESEGDDDFIHFADMDSRAFPRYFEEPEEDSDRRAHLVCGYCGAEGDHKTADCTVIVCLTCGAHDEHTTRQCPIVKTCFNCGMKGHINRDCPNGFTYRRPLDREYDECGRCGSITHSVKECPTLWRLYEYLDDADHERILELRRNKENLPLGEGGEGYIGEALWCYNCGGEGHLGDDCQIIPRQPDCKESSAFGLINVMTGPFSKKILKTSGQKIRREWEESDTFGDGHGFAGPSDVGKRGRDKERERMRRKEKEVIEIDDDEGDWFGNRLKSQTKPTPSGPRKIKPGEKFTFDLKGLTKYEDKQTPGDKLLARIDMESMDKRDKRERTKDRDRDRDRDRARNRDKDRDRNRDHRRKDERHRDSRGSSRRERDRNKALDKSGSSSKEINQRKDSRSGRQYYGGYDR